VSARPNARCAERRLVDRHFAARITPAEESAMRAHLPGCERCRRFYERHLLYARLAPGRPAVTDRLAAGLGVAREALPRAPAGRVPRLAGRSFSASPRTWMLAGAAAAGLALLLAGRGLPSADGEWGVRGMAGSGLGAALEVYRVRPDGSTEASQGWMAAGDELAFAYRNPGGLARLMVFAVDDRGDIYWFHPAWSDPAEDPVAVPIQSGPGPFELPEAIRHQPWSGRLRIVALFTELPLSVRALEARWRLGRFALPGDVRIEESLEVRP
jgi:hypothetical protein